MTRQESTALRSMAIVLMVAAGGLLTGCQGTVPTVGGDSKGTLRGILTNSMTGAPIAGASISLDPNPDGVTVTTGDDGAYSQELPVGVYTLTFETPDYNSESRTVYVDTGRMTTVSMTLEPMQAVAVRTTVEGDPVPGATITVTAKAEALDGTTTVSGFEWTASNSVDVTISGAKTATATITLPSLATYKDALIAALREAPIGPEQLPENVPVPPGEFPGGLPDRFQVVGVNPFALEEAGLVKLTVEVDTTSGKFSEEVDVLATLPWKMSPGIRNVPLGVPVLLAGKTQDSYNWSLKGPSGSTARLSDSTTVAPYFTPDVAGLYTVTVSDRTGETAETVTMEIYSGKWQGAITGQDADGRPIAAICSSCHNGDIAPDVFTPWAQTGHAEIFTDNINTSDHYSTSCVACHTVGYDPDADNGGFDDATDYQAFLDADLFHLVDSGIWDGMLDEFPATAQLANIQCENCHGPQNGAHMVSEARMSLSANVCGACHGEPARHGRFQQWQLSAHANYEVAIAEGENGTCAVCHTANGFMAWLPVLLDDDPATDPLAGVAVTWTEDEIHPQTCVVCHDPHSIGTVSGDATNATVRISGDTPPLVGGFTANGVGRGAICMTCHNSRRGLRNDSTFSTFAGTSEAARAPHGSAQTDVLMGQNAYLVDVGVRGAHSLVKDTCVTCHMVSTPPPDALSYSQGGTNHTFYAAKDICAQCHEEIFDADSLQSAYAATADALKKKVEAALLRLITERIAAGNRIDLGGLATLTSAAGITGVEFGESHGQQAITLTLNDGNTYGPASMSSVLVLDSGGNELGALYNFADERLAKAGWNWNLATNDGSKGVHNPSFVFQFLDSAIDALDALEAEKS